MSRSLVTVLTAALALLLAAPVAARAKSRCSGHAKHTKKCKKAAPRKPKPVPTTPIGVTLLEGSTATLDLGNGTVRTAPLTGSLKGGIPGGYQLGRDNTIKLTGGTLSIGATDILTDDCAAPPVASTNPATAVALDHKRPSAAVVRGTGAVSATAAVVLRTVLDLRSGACGSAATPGGYADTPLTVALHGMIAKGTGLSALTLDSDPQAVSVLACLSPGTPTAPCSGGPIPYPVTMTTHVVVKVAIG